MKAIAKLFADKSGILRAMIDVDFAKYYLKLFNYHTFNRMGRDLTTSRHGVHITVANPEFHKYDRSRVWRYKNRVIEFFFNPEKIYFSSPASKHFGAYIAVESPDINKIHEELGIVLGDKQNLHIALFTNKHLVKGNHARQLPAAS